MVAARAGQGQSPGLRNPRWSLPGWSAEAAAALFALVLYLPSLGFPFVFDDHALIDAGGRPLALGGSLPYRPVRYASYWIDAALGGSPLVYHAHSVLLFALLVALVVRVARRLGAGSAGALAGALLVAAHPLAVEAVAYVAGRRDLLSSVLGLGAILAWMDARRAAAIALLLLGAGAKESALLAAPVMMLASVCAVAARRSGDRRLLVVGGVVAVALVLGYGAIGPWTPAPEWAGLALPGRVLGHYADHLLRPLLLVGAGLAAEYPDLVSFVARVRAGDLAGTAQATAWMSVTLSMAAVVVATTTALVLRRSRIAPVQPGSALLRHPGVGASDGAGASAGAGASDDAGASDCAGASAGAGASDGAGAARSSWNFVAAWAVLSVAALAIWGGLHEPGVDRHALVVLPVAGVAAALALARLHGQARTATFVLAAAALLALASATREQMEFWRSDGALWAHTVAAQPDAARARVNLAGLLAAEGRYGEAARHLDFALRLQPGFVAAYIGRAVVRCAQARPVAARRDLTRALAMGAEFASIEGIGRDCPLPEFVVSSPRVAGSPAAASPAATALPQAVGPALTQEART